MIILLGPALPLFPCTVTPTPQVHPTDFLSSSALPLVSTQRHQSVYSAEGDDLDSLPFSEIVLQLADKVK